MKEIFERVSIRRFTAEAVPAEAIGQMLRAAMAAPSAGNQQPWEFFVVTDPEKIRALSEVHVYSKCCGGAPLVIVPCMRTRNLRYPEYDTIDMAAATENLLLAATSLGLGSVWIGIAPKEDRIRKVDRILGIGEGLHAFALFAVGYPAEEKAQQDRYEESRVHRL